MAILGIPANTIAVLQKYNFTFQKKFGQNFLIDTHVLDRIISAAEITKEDCVIEIGPGIGTMTQYLAENAREVIAVEIDKALIPILQDTLSSYDNVTVINEDILKVDIQKLAEEHNGGKPIKVVANLPYYITTPIIMGLFESHVPLASITIMVQKEVADRFYAQPGSKDYNALSVITQFRCSVHPVMKVPRNVFMPKPNVDSAVLQFRFIEHEPLDEERFFAMVKACFGMRRKTILNNFSSVCENKQHAEKMLISADIDPRVRSEQLDLKAFLRLYEVYENESGSTC